MKRKDSVHGYQGGYLIGFIIIGVTALRNILLYEGTPVFVIMIALLVTYTLLYITEPWLLIRWQQVRFFYFPLQTVLVIALTTLQQDQICSYHRPSRNVLLETFVGMISQ